MTLLILLCAIAGGVLGYVYTTKLRSNTISPVVGGGVGVIGGAIVGGIIRAIFAPMLWVLGIALVGAIAFYAYKFFGKK